MKKLIATLVAIVGGVIIVWSAYYWFGRHQEVYGYHPMFPGLLGIGLATAGLIGRQE